MMKGWTGRTSCPTLVLRHQLHGNSVPHQETAVKDVIQGFSEADRGQLIMACGTGKTYTALKIAERQAGAAAGGYCSWYPPYPCYPRACASGRLITSGPGSARLPCARTPKVGRTNEDINSYDMAIPPTTDGRKLADGLVSDLPAGHVQLVFATYHSIGVVHDAQQRGAPGLRSRDMR